MYTSTYSFRPLTWTGVVSMVTLKFLFLASTDRDLNSKLEESLPTLLLATQSLPNIRIAFARWESSIVLIFTALPSFCVHSSCLRCAIRRSRKPWYVIDAKPVSSTSITTDLIVASLNPSTYPRSLIIVPTVEMIGTAKHTATKVSIMCGSVSGSRTHHQLLERQWSRPIDGDAAEKW